MSDPRTGSKARAALWTILMALFLMPISAGRAADVWDCGDYSQGGVPSSPASPAAVRAVPYPEDGSALTVFAAASLTDAFTEIGAVLEAAHPGLSLTFNFAGSQTLVTQVAQGAPADLLALAAEPQMTAAENEGLIAGDPVTFARNELAVIVPGDNPAGVETPADLANDGVKILLAAPEVPAGYYARQSLCAMAADAETYGEDFIARVAANVVSQEDQVRAVLAKIALNEADAGIVYASDRTTEAAGEVVTIAIPADVNVIASYPIAVTSEGDAPLAEAFISFVLSDEGQAILASYGFLPA